MIGRGQVLSIISVKELGLGKFNLNLANGIQLGVKHSMSTGNELYMVLDVFKSRCSWDFTYPNTLANHWC